MPLEKLKVLKLNQESYFLKGFWTGFGPRSKTPRLAKKMGWHGAAWHCKGGQGVKYIIGLIIYTISLISYVRFNHAHGFLFRCAVPSSLEGVRQRIVNYVLVVCWYMTTLPGWNSTLRLRIVCGACCCRRWGGVRYHCFTFAFSDITWRSLERVPGPVETYWSILKCMLPFEHTRTYRKTTKPISPYWTLWGPLEEYQNISEHNTRTLPCWTRWSPIGPYRNIWKHIKRTFQVNHMNT